MNDDKTDLGLQPIVGGRTALFGLQIDDPALKSLNVMGQQVERADSRTLFDGFVTGPSPVHRAICPLFAAPQDPHNDAVSVIEVLVSSGFDGEIVVLAPPLLRPKMVETELRHLARGRRLRLLAGVLPPLTEI